MIEFLQEASGQPWAYAVVAACALLDGFFPPVPSEVLVVAMASLLASHGWAGLWMLAPAAIVGAFAGDNLAYAMGRALGTTRFRWMRRPFMQKSFAAAGKQLESRGAAMMMVARFLPVARVAANLTAGATGFPRRKFVAISAVSASLWAAYCIGLGALAGSWFAANPILALTVAVVAACLLGIVLDRVSAALRRRRLVDGVDATTGWREGDARGAGTETQTSPAVQESAGVK
ncbi:membrane protein DedA with SNARE-associated domain [Arthrobacter stackebrandtii]|uniref:Membrane protein DedA with SNARE-associated domain n=1 Tax=Arthrobacter stackebrandtii TaxID=272161 RepID=A0ABS4Z165_9MICC|nr:DedA family protein [Arthrobacter stackebrandtii]MBP2414724.1 membrane protein DedA with SNARE-associated domain [Arthrobacter stackebrandtii]PYH01808.1 alkaline phosphatase [Arthrobacter stackebrandtii]